jgi:mitogen-activated protein kinase 1/3
MSFHKFTVGGQSFTTDAKYMPLRALGAGAFGSVCQARDTVLNRQVAIKLVPEALGNPDDAKKIIREIKILKHLNHTNIIKILDMIPPPFPNAKISDVYIVMECMETDLCSIVNKQPAEQYTPQHIQWWMYQCLAGLNHMHSGDVMHRDLKPSNLLVNADCTLKICDFGLARQLKDEIEGKDENANQVMSEYVQTRWYRAPEVMLSDGYSKAADIWSVGCIMAELFRRTPLFRGHDYINQATLILQALGKPEQEVWERVVTNPKAREYFDKQDFKSPSFPISEAQINNADAFDLLKKLLTFDPSARLTAAQALEHKYFERLRNFRDTTPCRNRFEWEFDPDRTYEEREFEEMVQELIHSFRPPQ